MLCGGNSTQFLTLSIQNFTPHHPRRWCCVLRMLVPSCFHPSPSPRSRAITPSCFFFPRPPLPLLSASFPPSLFPAVDRKLASLPSYSVAARAFAVCQGPTSALLYFHFHPVLRPKLSPTVRTQTVSYPFDRSFMHVIPPLIFNPIVVSFMSTPRQGSIHPLPFPITHLTPLPLKVTSIFTYPTDEFSIFSILFFSNLSLVFFSLLFTLLG